MKVPCRENGFIKIVKILRLYEDIKSKNASQRFRAIVEKFLTSEELERYTNSPELHADFEVVQEDGTYENISIDSFRKKCVVLFAPVTRHVEDVIEEFGHKFLDSVYVCRYKMFRSGMDVTFSEALRYEDDSSESEVEEVPKRKHYRVMSLNCDNDQLKLKLKRKSLCSPEKIDLCTPMVLLEKLNLNDLKKSPVKRSLWTDPSKENDGNVMNKSKRKQRFNHEMYKTETADPIIDEIILEKKECPKIKIVINDKHGNIRSGRKQNFSRKMYDADVIVDEIIISKNVEKSPERRCTKPVVKSPKRKLNNGVIFLDSDDSDVDLINKTPVKMKKTDESIDMLSCKLKSKLGIVTPKKTCDTPKSTPRRKRLTRLDENEEAKTPKTKKASEDEDDGRKSLRLRRSVRKISTENEPVRRSTRMSLRSTPKKIIESSDDDDFKPKKRTTLRNAPKKIETSDDDFKPVNKTLQTVVKTPSKSSPKLKITTLTPQVENRATALTPSNNPFELARTQLTSELRPGCLPCREKEFDDIMTFLSGKLSDNSGGCMYISGVPGTGKTATVREIMKVLKKKSRNDFKFLSINALSLTEPRQCYVEIVKQLSNKTLRWDSALDHLRNFFLKQKHLLHVLLIDELDKLCTRKQDVVYNLLDLPSASKTPLVVITIANTMDLPERLLSNKVNSRLGLTRLTFHPYKHKELVDIVKTRLKKHSGVFRSEALEFVAR